MFEKYYRWLYKPFHNKKHSKIIEMYRQNNLAVSGLDTLVPDSRELFTRPEEQIKAIGLRLLDILDQLASIGKFEFSLAYGTMLGAVRHNGFIPWDDDIDVFITKSQFQKMLKVSHELPINILFTPIDVGFFKIMDISSIVSLDQKRGVAVDIFIIEDSHIENLHFFNVHTQKNLYFRRTDFQPLTKHVFEDSYYNIPSNYEEILSKLYGNYMKLPPKEKRTSHHSNLHEVIIGKYGEILVDKNNIDI